jgi:hypothetical protein
MPIPKLHHPVPIVIEPIDRTDTVYDPYAREPVGQVVREGESTGTGDQVTIKGQVSYYGSGFKQDYPEATNWGIEEKTMGYIACRYKDLISGGLVTESGGVYTKVKIKRGDRIVQIGKEEVNYYITGYKPFAHYPKQKQTMIQINFEDRHPSDQQGAL